jgi:predicted nucleotidyltransferase
MFQGVKGVLSRLWLTLSPQPVGIGVVLCCRNDDIDCGAAMAEVVTVPERKAREAARRRTAASVVMAELKTYAVEHGGRFLVFGSVAEDRMSFQSDFDVVVDFPADRENDAIDFVEDLCRAQDLPADVHPKSLASDRFLARIAGHAVSLP